MKHETKECDVLHKWRGDPKYIAVLPVATDMSFEAAALEEYLIKSPGPLNNTRGVRRSDSPRKRLL
jgi:hypothetical protein